MMTFQTYGPFEFTEWSSTGVDKFYETFTADHPELESAIGVYIVAVKKGKKLIPYYVGKTVRRSFGHRLKEHFDSAKLEELYRKFGNLYFFLIPRVTDAGRTKKSASRGKKIGSIDHLEFALIGSCLLRNPALLNKQQKRFHENLRVPGYLNRDPKSENQSAKHLADMLGTSLQA